MSTEPERATPTGPDKGAQGFLISHRRAAVALLDLPEQFTCAEAPDVVARHVQRCAGHDIFQAVGRATTTSNSEVIVWTVPEGVRAWIDANIDHSHRTPCGHSGVRCLVSGEEYTCTEDYCDAVFDRETAKEVMSS